MAIFWKNDHLTLNEPVKPAKLVSRFIYMQTLKKRKKSKLDFEIIFIELFAQKDQNSRRLMENAIKNFYIFLTFSFCSLVVSCWISRS